jgi:putative membrane protein
MFPDIFRNSFLFHAPPLQGAGALHLSPHRISQRIRARRPRAQALSTSGMPLAKSPCVNTVLCTKWFRAIGSWLLATLAVGVGVSFIAGCERVDYRAIPGDSIRSGWASPERPSLITPAPSEQTFLVSVAESGLFEIEASRLAVARGGSAAVRRFAEATLRDRVAVDTDLQQLAASVGVALPSQLSDTLRARLDVLRHLSGSDFDRAYARNVGVMAQEEALTAFERAADRHGARVQRFAAEQLPALRKHLEWARELASDLDSQTMA